MNKAPELLLISPKEITLSDPCLFWAREPEQDFVRSIERIGQIEPVLIMDISGRKTLVAGYRRARALIRLGRDIMALEIPPAGEYQKGLVYLLSNQNQSLNPGKIIPALRYFQSAGSLSQEVWTELEIKPGSKMQTLWQNWLDLPFAWDTLLAQGNISLECSRTLKHAGPEDLQCLFPFFSRLSWSRNNSINLLTWLHEKARMDHKGLRQLVEELNLASILDTDLSPQDKIKTILKLAFQARYPVLSTMKNDLEQRLRSTAAGSGWRVEHRDEFESREIQFSTRINSRHDLKKALAGLERIYQSGALDDWPVK
ncbi:MAG: ParB/RepB/Spo0J family partition protein [Desulfonatronovibrio sp.]